MFFGLHPFHWWFFNLRVGPTRRVWHLTVQAVVLTVRQRPMPHQERLVQRLSLGVHFQFVTVPLGIRVFPPDVPYSCYVSFSFSPALHITPPLLRIQGTGSHRKYVCGEAPQPLLAQSSRLQTYLKVAWILTLRLIATWILTLRLKAKLTLRLHGN